MKSKAELAEIAKSGMDDKEYESQGRGKTEADLVSKKFAKQMERDYDD